MSRTIGKNDSENEKVESINNYRDLFKPLVRKPPTIESALDQLYESMELEDPETQRNIVISECKKYVEKNFEKIKNVHPNVTEEEALVIAIYSYEDSKSKLSPYRVLNTNLVSNDRKNGIKKVTEYCFLLLKSIRNLTPFKMDGKLLFRGLRVKVNQIQSDNPNYVPYQKGNVKTFWGFTSTSLDNSGTFLGRKGDSGFKSGTIFTITGDVVGYDISPFSMYDEQEILMEPERQVKINTMVEINDIVNISCQVLNTPLVLGDLIRSRNQKGDEIRVENKKSEKLNSINVINERNNDGNQINDAQRKSQKNESGM